MKKIVLAVILASAVIAAENGFYVGADIGNTEFNIKVSALGVSAEDKDDGGSQTLKIGYYFNLNNRVSAFYQNINTEGGDTYTYGIGYDYLIGDNAFKPFVGAIAGYGFSKTDEPVYDSPLTLSGNIYGAQVGINYAFNENFSAEAGYRYLKSEINENTMVSNIDIKLEMDTIQNWFFGINYKF